VFSDLRLISNRVWGLAKTDEEWATKLEAALAATRRDDLVSGWRGELGPNGFRGLS
jgi:hypothetical protein